MAALNDIIDEMVSSYGDLSAMARSAQVSAKDVAAALAKAKPDTAEFVVLSLLAQANPVTVSVAPVAPEE